MAWPSQSIMLVSLSDSATSGKFIHPHSSLTCISKFTWTC
jgi:hypothetical protein